MLSVSRLVAILLIAIFAVALAAPRQFVMGFGKRSVASFEDDVAEGSPKLKRYKTKGFAMGFGKRGQIRGFNMGFGKRSGNDLVEPSYDDLSQYF
ncbi:unnamed protein product [Caenorhabditis angaria]|uniref:Uncharacterized protein n=1 Tax=Caenorhabditis angaria TaxID=860376 RepID=A0A9P1J2Q6_9PELO|nr:unnamed protein product [Caenorhabditis angaria]